MSDTSGFLQSYSEEDYSAMMSNFDRKALVNLANDKATLPHLARQKLQELLLAALGDMGVPSPKLFYEAIKSHEAVLSGSFVPSFMDPDFSATWPHTLSGPRDLDVYVGHGKLDDMLVAIRNLPGAQMHVLAKAKAPTSTGHEEGHPTVGAVSSWFYNNAAISAMARVRLKIPGSRYCFMDVMESKSKSAMLPIARFNLTHLRAAICADGIIELHPTWSNHRRTFASPRVQRSVPEEDQEDFYSSVDRFYDKYRARGYDVVEGGRVDGIEPHVCREDVECPLTLRSTIDGGIKFTPITEEGAIRLCSGPPGLLADTVVYWTHGGKCVYSGDHEEPAVIYDSEGISGDAPPTDGLEY